ncbi:MAG: BACON domain-containing protein [Acidobacteria bacterium]|nr:BACON domain-containing protein [Acidobacteriota bacterium]
MISHYSRRPLRAVVGGLAVAVSMAGRAAAQVPPATLQVAPLRLTFITAEQSNPLPGQRIQIRNVGGGQLVWRARVTDRWITVTPSNGMDDMVAVVSIDPTGLQPGSYAGAVSIEAGTASGSPKFVDITLAIAPRRPPSPPGLKVAPDKVAFSASVGHRDKLTFRVRVQAERDQAVRWTAQADRPWLTVTPPQGFTPSEITLSAAPEQLPSGEHAGVVTIRGSGDAPAVLQIPVTLSLRSDGGPMAFSSTVMPTATLNIPYSRPVPVRGGRPPYAFQIVGGTLPPELALANGMLMGTPRQPGVFSFTVAAVDSSTPATSQTQQLSLAVVILDQNTALAVQPVSLELQATGARAAESSVAIVSGGPPLTWQAASDVPWLRITPAEGVAPSTVKVSVDTKGLSSGSYAAVITINMDGAPNSPVRVPVRVTVRQ